VSRPRSSFPSGSVWILIKISSQRMRNHRIPLGSQAKYLNTFSFHVRYRDYTVSQRKMYVTKHVCWCCRVLFFSEILKAFKARPSHPVNTDDPKRTSTPSSPCPAETRLTSRVSSRGILQLVITAHVSMPTKTQQPWAQEPKKNRCSTLFFALFKFYPVAVKIACLRS